MYRPSHHHDGSHRALVGTLCLAATFFALQWPAAVVAAAPSSPGAAQTPPPVPRSRYQALPAFDVPETPNELDRIGVVQHWAGPGEPPPSAILILVPGLLGGAEDFRYVGERLVQRLPWLHVWAVDRRSNFLENRSAMELAQRAGDARLAAAYYLLGQDLPGCPPHADLDPNTWNGPGQEAALSQQEAAALGISQWGLRTALEDLRLLIAYAHARHPRARIFLGGHSLGGMTAQLYAGWRFGSTPDTAGWRTIDGIVLIDGGVDGPNWSPLLIGQYLRDKQLIAAGTVYWDNVAEGVSPLVGQLAEIGALAASLQPAAESFLWQMLPPPFRWSNPMTAPTNKALFAALTDNDYGPDPSFRLHQGKLVAPVDLNRDGLPDRAAAPNASRFLAHWRDFNQVTLPELASTDLWARSLWQSQATNLTEWYNAIRLNADIDLASNLDSTAPAAELGGAAATLEGHRVFDTRAVSVPVYAFAAQEGRGRFDWYRTQATSLPSFKLEDHSDEFTPTPAPVPYMHLDPLFAADTDGHTNAFLATVADWLATHRYANDARRPGLGLRIGR